MKKLFLIILAILFFISCFRKNNSDNSPKKVLFAFEKELIKQQVLENNKGISYVKLLKEISHKNDINYNYNYSFIDSLEILKNIDITTYLRHQKELIFDRAMAYEKLMSNNTEEMDLHPGMVAKKFLSITKAKDFENAYFKLQFLLFFDLANIHL